MAFSIKNLFIQPTEEPVKEEVVQKTETPVVQQTTTNSTSVAPDQKQLEKFTKILVDALEASNVEGFDYLEFRAAVLDMASSIPDEATRFRAAYASAKAMKCDGERLISTAKHYIDALKKEEKSFMDELGTKLVQSEEKRKAITSYDKEIEATRKQIEELNLKIQTISAEKIKKEQETLSEKTVLDAAKNNYYLALNPILNSIQSDITKIQTYFPTEAKNEYPNN